MLVDTGYLSIAEDGTQETYMANGGDELPIYIKTFQLAFSVNTDDTPPAGVTQPDVTTIGTYTSPTTSVSNPILTCSCRYDISRSDDRTAFKQLELASRTRGIKEMYYKHDAVGAASSREYNILDVFGETDDQNTSYKHIHVKIKSIDIVQQSTHAEKIHFNLVMEVLG